VAAATIDPQLGGKLIGIRMRMGMLRHMITLFETIL